MARSLFIPEMTNLDVREYLLGAGRPQFFRSQVLLRHLAQRDVVDLNCLEMTALIVSLANLLGSCLLPAEIESCLLNFDTNCIWALGRTPGECRVNFQRHVVAVQTPQFADLSDARVCDDVRSVTASPTLV